jgi:hypothetical protein
VGPRVAVNHLLPQDYPEQSHGVHTVLPCLRRGGHPPHGLRVHVPQAQGLSENQNQRAREDSLDHVDEARDVAILHSARYQQLLRRYQAQKVRC